MTYAPLVPSQRLAAFYTADRTMAPILACASSPLHAYDDGEDDYDSEPDSSSTCSSASDRDFSEPETSSEDEEAPTLATKPVPSAAAATAATAAPRSAAATNVLRTLAKFKKYRPTDGSAPSKPASVPAVPQPDATLPPRTRQPGPKPELRLNTVVRTGAAPMQEPPTTGITVHSIPALNVSHLRTQSQPESSPLLPNPHPPSPHPLSSSPDIHYSGSIPSITVTPPPNSPCMPLLAPEPNATSPGHLDALPFDIQAYRRALWNPSWATRMAGQCARDAWQRRRFDLVFAIGRREGIQMPTFEQSRREVEAQRRMLEARAGAEKERRESERRMRAEKGMWV